ncbi:cysteine desulfurase family protein [Sphingomonas sp. LY160]|uniref:cysteine desulfurase family protein n=1 Tax=Sphingomonas sp. LY160 TaxID=3095342 RepID=UPI002ADEE8F8|nr:cysteine desulfurase family protein [Sphingomonas sp. LY160]MEA1071170.1 cysteine desulfurase family protein [Sphingomonas sp. LY160]
MIYLDYQATTPVAPEVAAAMRPWIEEKFANPHSPSTWGREAAAAIEVARDKILSAAALDEGRFAFTSGATEALNWAIAGTLERSERRKIVTIATEHAAVLDCADWFESKGYQVVRLPVGADGIVDLDEARHAIDGRTALVAAMLVNNEIGVIQPVTELAVLAHSVGATMLCDAVQGFGRMELPVGPDLIAVSAHKVHGPKGVGGLWMRKSFEPRPLLHGGGQEMGLRSGTLSPGLCIGFGEAAGIAVDRRDRDASHVEKLWVAAANALGPDWQVNGSVEHRYHGNLSIRREGLDAARLMSDLRNLAFSLGSACASGSGRPSHVLRALGLSDREARSSIRLGFGRYTGEGELTSAFRSIEEAARSQRVYG